ncbi:MAG TPA: NUDIX domain-containing protein [Caldilineaceae bacterium]|nr:NUDIX domain-containing protein [Caldilineaceae bacterium]
MAKLIYGDRIGQTAALRVGASAVIYDESGQKVLLTRRTDNGRWCLPGGGMELGESAAEACIREVWEETGLQVTVRRLIGIYTTPHRIIEYANGSRFQYASFSFEAEVVGGELGLSNETTAFAYYSRAEMAQIDLMEHHIERIEDAFAAQEAAFVR